MVFDYKKEYKEFYIPPKKPGLIEIPEINYIAVRGKGNPNEPEGESTNLFIIQNLMIINHKP